MSDPLELAGAIGSAIFGAGVAWASLQYRIKAIEVRASTAIEQAQDALKRLAEEKNRSTRQDGDLRLYEERIANLRADVDALMGAVFQSRIRSPSVPMPAARVPRPDVPRQDSEPPLVRPRAPSIRRNDT